jgi:group I intron endonuclease
MILKYKYYYIYKIVNLYNKKCYVGFHATNIEYDQYFGSGVLLHKAIDKYGIDNFVKGIIEYVNPNNWQKREQYWIKKLNAHTTLGGYNETWGGYGRLGSKQSKESRIKTSNSMKNRYKDLSWEERYGDEVAKKMRIDIKSRIGDQTSMYGKFHSIETKQKMSKSSLGNSKSNEHKKNISKSCKGKTWEERYGKETAEKMKLSRRKKRNEYIK